MKIDLYVCLINLKWAKDLNFKPEILKLVEDNVRSRLCDTDVGKRLLNRTQAKKGQIAVHEIEKNMHSKRNSVEETDSL